MPLHRGSLEASRLLCGGLRCGCTPERGTGSKKNTGFFPGNMELTFVFSNKETVRSCRDD